MKAMLALLIVATDLAGCAHTIVVQLKAPDDYSPPAEIPFLSEADKKDYLTAYKDEWLHVARTRLYEVNVPDRTYIVSIEERGLYRKDAGEALIQGQLDGYRQAVRKLEEKLDKVLGRCKIPNTPSDRTR